MKPEKIFKSFFLAIAFFVYTMSVAAQTTEFTYQGKLTDAAGSSSTYDFEFRLFDTETGGTPLATIQRTNIPVLNGVFAVHLDFGSQFDGNIRYLEIAVSRAGQNNYTTLNPRQSFTSTPYAVRAISSSTADVALNAQQLGGVSAAQFIQDSDPRLTDARTPIAGSGNYIQNQNSAPQASTNFNISGTGEANIFNAATQFNIGGQRVLSIQGNGNTYAGANAGVSPNNTGQINSFFGAYAGYSNTTGKFNSFFGADVGNDNTTGSDNSFFGVTAGRFNTTGGFNSAFGRGAGQNNTTGSNNTSFGALAGINTTTGGDNTSVGNRAGTVNKTGSNNTAIGSFANFGSDNLNYATAIGAGAIVGTSNTVVLGRSVDTVQIPGNLNVSGSIAFGTFNANIFNATTQYNIGGNRVFSIPGMTNTFAGMNSGTLSTGLINSFFGFGAGQSNTTGASNSFFGADSGLSNTTGESNAGVGRGAGYTNTTGNFNVFVGRDSGENNLTGSNNTFLGYNAKPTLGDLNFATAIGAGAVASTSNTLVLGRNADTVQIPGILNVATQYNIGGARVLSTPVDNTFLGISAGSNSTGNRNAFFGSFAGTSNTTASNNSFFGAEAGGGNTTGSQNVFVGNKAGRSNTTGGDNTFLGTEAGDNNNGNNNTFLGRAAGYNNTSGIRNTIVGSQAGASFSSGNNITLLGAFSSAADNLTNATAVGANAVVNRNDSVVLGNNANVGIGTSSPSAKLQVNNGDVYVGTIGGGVILRSPNGSCFRLSVNNAGALAAIAVTCPN